MQRPAITVCLLLLGLTSIAWTQPSPLAAATQDPFRPAQEHALLQQRLGTWDADVVAPGRDGSPSRTKATLTVGKHTDWHTIDEFRGELMGVPLLGHGVHSWCPVRRTFLLHWVDSMSPSPMAMTGAFDAKTKELTMSGECFSATGALAPCRAVTKFVDADHMTWTFFATGLDGRLTEQLRADYTRRKV